MKAQTLGLVQTVQRQVVAMLRGPSQTIREEPSFTEPACWPLPGAPQALSGPHSSPVSQALTHCHPQAEMRQLKHREAKEPA